MCGAGVSHHLVVAVGQQEVGIGRIAVALVQFAACVGIADQHTRVERQGDGAGGEVQLADGGTVLRTGGGELQGLFGTAHVGHAYFVVVARGVVGQADGLGRNDHAVRFAAFERTLAELDGHGLSVGLKAHGVGHRLAADNLDELHCVGIAHHRHLAVEGNLQGVEFGNAGTGLRRNEVIAQQVGLCGQLGQALGQGHDESLVRADGGEDGVAVVADAHGGAGVFLSHLFHDVHAVNLLHALGEPDPVLSAAHAEVTVGVGRGRGGVNLSVVVHTPAALVGTLCVVVHLYGAGFHVVDEGSFVFTGELASAHLLHHIGTARNVTSVVAQRGMGDVHRAVNVCLPASGFGLVEADGVVRLLVAVVHVAENAAEVVAGREVAEGHGAHDGIAVGRDVGEAVHLLVHVCHVLGGDARRFEELVGGEVPKGHFLLVEACRVGKVEPSHSIFTIGRYGADHTPVGIAVKAEEGPLTRRNGVISGFVVEQTHHDVAVIGNVEGRTAEDSIGLQPFQQRSGNTRLGVDELRAHHVVGILAARATGHGPSAIV